MKHRLKLKQQQESHQAELQSGSDLSTTTLLTTLGCSAILALNYFAQTGQQWTSPLAYLMSLAMVSAIMCQMKSRLALSEESTVHQSNGSVLLDQDERALQTATTPLRNAHEYESNKTRIVSQAPDAMVIEPCLGSHYVAFGIASLVSLSVALMLLAAWLQPADTAIFTRLKAIPAEFQTTLVLVGLVFVAIIINQLHQPASRVVFEKNNGVFWIEHVLLFGLKTKVSAQMPIAHIIALQQLNKTTHSDEGLTHNLSLMPFHTTQDCEVNIVFRNTERVNLFHFKSEQVLNREITRISRFLDVPVWKQQS